MDNSLFAIEVDTADYATIAAADKPSTSVDNPNNDRTHQSEAAFEAVKACYAAKIDGAETGKVKGRGGLWKEFLGEVPALAATDREGKEGERKYGDGERGMQKVKLTKRQQLLLGYAVAEFYYDGLFAEVVGVCERVERRCRLDGRAGEAVLRWREKAAGRVESEKRIVKG